MKTNLIAPCGMNCGTCVAFLREKNRCPGCRNLKNNIPISINRCMARNCQTFSDGKKKFCFECETFPCQMIKRLEKRYSTKYHLSLIENLETIKKIGIKKFIELEEIKWKCKNCGGTICVHRGICLNCKK